MRGHMHLLQDHPLALPQRATKIGISASRSFRPGTGSAKALSPAALVRRPKHPACLQDTRRTDQAGKSHPTASSDLQGAQTARAGGRPSILPAEPSLPAPKSQGDAPSAPEAYGNQGPSLPLPRARASSQSLVPFRQRKLTRDTAMGTRGDPGTDYCFIPNRFWYKRDGLFSTFPTDSGGLSPGLHGS